MSSETRDPKIYSRRKGAVAAPPDAVYVGRFDRFRADACPVNPWSNPFHIVVNSASQRLAACDYFEGYALDRLARDPHWLEPLRGKDLVCWCKDTPESKVRCHAETLLRLANLSPKERT